MQYSIKYQLYKQNKEIDELYEMRYEAAAIRKAQLHKKSIYFRRRGELTLLVTATIVLCIALFIRLFLYEDMKLHEQNITALSTEISRLHQENSDTQRRLETSVDLTEIEKQAKKLGMEKITDQNVIFYQIPKKDYMAYIEFADAQ